MAQANVSGPGVFSQRTDTPGQTARAIPNAAYGEQKEFSDIQGGAKMASEGKPQLPQVTRLDAPTQRPDEPVTAGMPSGPGLGPESIGMGMNMKDQTTQDVSKIAEYLPSLTRMANSPGVPTSFVRFVKYIRDNGS